MWALPCCMRVGGLISALRIGEPRQPRHVCFDTSGSPLQGCMHVSQQRLHDNNSIVAAGVYGLGHHRSRLDIQNHVQSCNAASRRARVAGFPPLKILLGVHKLLSNTAKFLVEGVDIRIASTGMSSTNWGVWGDDTTKQPHKTDEPEVASGTTSPETSATTMGWRCRMHATIVPQQRSPL